MKAFGDAMSQVPGKNRLRVAGGTRRDAAVDSIARLSGRPGVADRLEGPGASREFL